MHRGHPVNVLIQRTTHLSSVIPANDTKERVPHLELRTTPTTQPKVKKSAKANSAQCKIPNVTTLPTFLELLKHVCYAM